MATVIDSLIVKLGLDSSDFKKGEKDLNEGLDKTRKKTEKTRKDLEETGKGGAEAFETIRKSAIRFLAILTVGKGAIEFSRMVVGTGARLDRMSRNLQVNVGNLSRWQGAVRQSGGSAEGLMGTMQGLSGALTELRLTGTTGILPYLQALGVAVAGVDGKARPLDDILMDIGDKLNALPNRADAFNIGQSLGLDEGTINLLLKGRTEVERLLSAQQEYSAEDARAARLAQENWEKTKLRIERLSQTIVITLLPVFERLTDGMVKIAEIAVPMIDKVATMFVAVDEATNGWATTLAIALVTLRLITGPGMIGKIGSLGKALLGLSRIGAVGVAGAAGYGAGTLIHDKFLAGTEASDTIGRSIARVLAFFGNENAQQALDAEAGISSSSSGAGGSRAARNFNPGNLEFRGQRGAVPEDGSGRFARFGSMSEGVAALVRQLKLYESRGITTLDDIISTYAPSSENDTQAYIQALASRMGVTGSQQLNMSDPAVMAELVRGISRHEAGGNILSDQDVLSGLRMAGMSPGAGGGNISVGEVKVYTQATDANGIARDLGAALIRQADTGMR